jgi:hypothetical protein
MVSPRRGLHAAAVVVIALSAAVSLRSAAVSASSSAPVHGAMLMRPDSAGRRMPAAPSPVPAARDTGWLENEPPEPAATYRTFAIAAESLAVLVHRTLGACADSERSTIGPSPFLYVDKLTLEHASTGRPYWFIEPRNTSVTVPSRKVELVTTRADCPGWETLADTLLAAGWVEDPHYDADGPDGSISAWFCREALCRVEAGWDGGDDADSTVVPLPGYRLELTCVPRPPEDPAARRVRR